MNFLYSQISKYTYLLNNLKNVIFYKKSNNKFKDEFDFMNKLTYDEKLFVGYKWYDREKIKTLFPFGHGLSYTQFKYTDLKVEALNNNNFVCSYRVTNTGKQAGDEISQCYISFKDHKKSDPYKKLQGFDKTLIEPGETKEIQIKIESKSFKTWNISKHNWVIEKGIYEILIGASSEDIRLRDEIIL